MYIHVHVLYLLLSPSLLPPSAPVVASSPYVQELDVLTLKTIATEASDSMIMCIHLYDIHVHVFVHVYMYMYNVRGISGF